MKHVTVLLFACAVATPSLAQPQPKPTRLTLRPAGPAVPALKYALLPELRASKPGNAALLYYRSFSPEWYNLRRPEVQKIINQWKPDEAPGEDLRRLAFNSPGLKEVDRAARRAYCDWELAPRVREDGIMLLLPDLQSMRRTAHFLTARARAHIADKNHDQTQYTFQTCLAMARDVAKGPTLIHYLVGAAIAHVSLDQMEQWIQSPGSPNLYWPLTALPRPFMEMRRNLEGEYLMIEEMFPGYRDVVRQPGKRSLPPGSTRKAVNSYLIALQQGSPGSKNDFNDWMKRLLVGARAATAHESAIAVLAQHGFTEEQIARLSKVDVVVLAEVAEYDRVLDSARKWMTLPYPQARKEIAKVMDHVQKGWRGDRNGLLLAKTFVPSMGAVLDAQVRLERRIAALRVIEALRLHAAGNKGKFPQKLSEITLVPVPNDPVTGKPFDYEAGKGTARLHGGPPEGEAVNRSNSITFELDLKDS